MYDVSIIIATYNSSLEKTLRTICSCLSQEGLRKQIIIADDGSDVTHFGILTCFFNERGFTDYILIENKSNQGIVSNVLSGVRQAGAEYVKTISPGDYFYDSHSLYRMIQKLRIENAHVCFGRGVFYHEKDGSYTIFNERRPFVMSPYTADQKSVKQDSAKRNSIRYRDGIYGAMAAYRTQSVAKALSYIEGKIRYCEDYCIRIMLAKGLKCAFVDEYVVWYEYGTGVSSNVQSESSKVIDADWLALSQIMAKLFPSDLDVAALVLDIQTKESQSPRLIKDMRRFFNDPYRLYYGIRRRLVKRCYKVGGYDINNLKCQFEKFGIDSYLSPKEG